jgi:non-canonical purine NTP pyrophosphatase (RdgB/HAM1 family)
VRTREQLRGRRTVEAAPVPVTFATTNQLKIAEARHFIPHLVPADLGLSEVQALDPAVVVRDKLSQVGRRGLPGAVIVEDTGLLIDGWDGLPGALVKWFMQTLGPAGLADLARCGGKSPAAEAVSAVGAWHRGETRVWCGRLSGTIVTPRGDLEGWTPIFEVSGSGETLAEMSATDRTAVTMRRAPLESAWTWLCARQKGE